MFLGSTAMYILFNYLLQILQIHLLIHFMGQVREQGL